MSEINNFINKHILSLQKESHSYTNAKIDKTSDSYFEQPKREKDLYYRFLELIEEDKLEEMLNELWKDDKELLPIVKDLTKLAFHLKDQNVQQSDDISEFVYVMF